MQMCRTQQVFLSQAGVILLANVQCTWHSVVQLFAAFHLFAHRSCQRYYVQTVCRREQHVQDDLQADVLQSSHQQNVKRSRRSCSSDRGFVFANAVHPESVNALHHADAPASRTGQWMGYMHGMAKAASAHTGHSRVPAYGNSQEANDGALCWGRCSPGRRNQATALHAEDACGIPSVGAQLSSGAVGTAGTTPSASESFRTRQRYYNEHACAGRSGRASRRSRSRSPISERQRQHPRLAAGHSETRPKNSQRTPHLLASGDLRWRHTSSHLVPRQSPPRHH